MSVSYSIICLGCVIVQVLLLMEYERIKRRDDNSHFFRWFLLISILAIGVDFIWGLILIAGEKQTAIFMGTSSLNYATSCLAVYTWCVCGFYRSLDADSQKRKKKAQYIMLVPAVFLIATLVVKICTDISNPLDAENNLFRGGKYYEYSIYLVDGIYFVICFVAMVCGIIKARNNNKKIKNTTVVFCLIPIIFGIIQVEWWEQPWSSVGLMLSAVVIFIADITESREKAIIEENTRNYEVKIKSVEEQAVVRAVKFKNVMLANTESFVEANLTQNVIISKPIFSDKDGKKVMVDVKGDGEKCGYDEFTIWYATNKLSSNKTEYLVKNNSDYLIESYNNGNEVIEVRTNFKKADGTIIEAKHSCYLYRDEESGDVLTLSFLTDISSEIEKQKNKEKQEYALSDSVRVLYEEQNSTEAVQSLLRIVSEYYYSARTVIFEIDKNRLTLTNTYEWCREGTRSQIDNLKKVPIDSFERWFDSLENEGGFFIDSVDDGIDNRSVTYKLLKSQNIENILSVPIMQDGEICGFVAVENLKKYTEDVVVLKMAALLAYGEILRRKQSDEEHMTLNKLAESMVFLCYADIENDYMHIYGIADEYKERYSGAESYSEFMSRYIDSEVADSDKKRMRRIADTLFISEQLNNKDEYKINFEALRGEEIRNLSFELSRLDNKGKKVVLIGYDNTEAVVFERDAKNAMESAMKEAEEANAAKTHFLFNMSHDLRTPMNAVIGFAEMAERNMDNKEKLMDCLGKLKMSGNHLLNIINDVLELSRIESGQVEINPEPVEVSEGKRELESVFMSSLEARNLKYSFEHRNIRDEYIMMDKAKTTQIVFNIMSNAVKYTQPGGEVNYLMEQLDDNEKGQTVFRFTIRDNGVGMSKEYLNHIFELFSREKTTTESGVAGTGLGMAMVKELVDRMNGTVTIDSDLGEGTTVVCVIPFDRCTEEQITKIQGTSSSVERLEGRRILVVEDNELNREIVEDLLDELGIETDSAADGTIAVETIKKNGLDYYDLVLMDIQMPIMNGYEATKVIRRMYPDSATPIIALSANAFEEDRKKSQEAGMNEHVAKPVSSEKLKEVLSRFL